VHTPPALLVSYQYWDVFAPLRDKLAMRDYVLDSGAFSARTGGKTINLQQYIDFASERLQNDPQLTEVYALDCIGDHEKSLRNLEEMHRQGVPAIPTFHYGGPWEALIEISKYPKIALGGMVGKHEKAKLAWAEECFARVWPKRVHAFGSTSEPLNMALPFHSCDSSTWELRPSAFGIWAAYNNQTLSVRGGSQNLRVQVEHFLRFEKKLRWRWRKEMALLAQINQESTS